MGQPGFPRSVACGSMSRVWPRQLSNPVSSLPAAEGWAGQGARPRSCLWLLGVRTVPNQGLRVIFPLALITHHLHSL